MTETTPPDVSGDTGDAGASAAPIDAACLTAEACLAAEACLVDEARALGLALAARGWMVATAESCTGGAIARALSETAGSSAWLDRGFVTYSNESKRDLLRVGVETLERHGAVSEPTAHEMASGALAGSRAHLALSVTGIAGPGGAVPGKPVGTVCFGWALTAAPGGAPVVRTQTLRLSGDRVRVRLAAARHAVVQALRMVREAGPNPSASAKS